MVFGVSSVVICCGSQSTFHFVRSVGGETVGRCIHESMMRVESFEVLLFAVAGSHPVATNKDELKSLMAAHVAVVPARGCVCLLCNTVCSNQGGDSMTRIFLDQYSFVG